MRLSIENDKWIAGKGEDKTGYWSFWLRIRDGELSISVAGWKYKPTTRRVGSPSQLKDKKTNKFFDTTKFDQRTYTVIEDLAREYFKEEEK